MDRMSALTREGNTTAEASSGPGGQGASRLSYAPGRHHTEATFVERGADVPELL